MEPSEGLGGRCSARWTRGRWCGAPRLGARQEGVSRGMGRGVVVVLGGGPPPTRSSEAFSLPAEGAAPRASRGDRTVCLPRAGAQRNEACFKDLSPVTREIRAQGNSTEGGGKWEDSGSVLKKTLGIGNGVEIKRDVEGHPSFRRAPPRVRPPLRRRRGHGQRRFGPGRGPVVTPERSVSGISG